MLKYNKIKNEMIVKKISQADMAERIGMTREGFGRMLRDQSMKVNTLEKISEVLNVSPAYFFDNTQNQPKPKSYKINNQQLLIEEENQLNTENMKRLIETQEALIKMQKEKIEILEQKLAAFELGKALSKDVS